MDFRLTHEQETELFEEQAAMELRDKLREHFGLFAVVSPSCSWITGCLGDIDSMSYDELVALAEAEGVR